MQNDDPFFDKLLLRIGRLNYVWTNTESVLIHFIAGLLGTDKERAVIVFLTLNTTRARLDLVERLAKTESRPAADRDDILTCTSQLAALARLRNHYNHCIYSFDSESGGYKTILMRIADRKTDIRMGRSGEIDDAEIARIEQTITQLGALNVQMWDLIKRRAFPV
ncbi:hypothetical protein [Salipiger sp. PrR002]|uniref:hypothetical protein n=1 Tax=Salipiger sp. PrR002 TaxID=2706489 RepID=UPI0013BBDFF3|nr:hypothetical protein [Salipiger sp. PrR002]NDW01135.1 hypothetical protein [Salipiger sp. PrR002]NDW57938.1 hypothetical protein [Salipiger sp. PrR004]